jgi:predicted dehydrogenase
MNPAPKIVLVAIGGYGETYVKALLETPPPVPAEVVAGVDPAPDRCERLALFTRRGIPIFPSTEAFYASGLAADLAILSSPISLHAPQACEALGRGLHVLCEKPAAAVIQDVETMIRARDQANRVLAIGYQWSYCDAIQALKADILAGHYGRPRRAKALVLWARDEAYYARNRWAGHLQDAQGRWVLDSPAGNACAHYLHNLFYLLGATRETSARPVEVTAELYRAHPIPNFDTGAIRARTEQGADVLFLTSHAPRENLGPLFTLEFDQGSVSYTGRAIEGRLADGSVRSYPLEAPSDQKIWQTLEAIQGGRPVACGAEAAASQVLCLNGAHESAGPARDFPASLVRREGEPGHRKTWVEGLTETLTRCYESGRMPSEIGPDWARAGTPVSLKDYHRFPRA